MRVVADLQLHSKYSLATSRDMDLEHLARGAKLKGLNLLGTGDFTHPKWFAELKEKLQPIPGTGLFSYDGMTWMLSGEVSTVYEQEGRKRKVHHLIYAPDLDSAGQIGAALSRYGRMSSDGRPVLTGIDSAELVEVLTAISSSVVIIPAHAWTPWFGVFGAKSGFDSLEECYQDQAGKIFAIETGLSCYDSQTEVLTDNGWKKFNHLGPDDFVCTLDGETSEIEFQRPLRVFTSNYSGTMYRLRTNRVSLLVTPNHRLFYRPCDFRKRKSYRLEEAENLIHRSKIFKKDGVWKGRHEEFFTLPGVEVRHGSRFYSGARVIRERKIPIRPWLKFFGFWLAEGWVTEGGHAICLSNDDHHLLAEMRKALSEMGYNAYGRHGILKMRNYQLGQYLIQFGKARDKFIPKELKELSPILMRIMFEWYIKGDGHIYGRTGKGLSATTESMRLRDDLQEVALKLGMSAYFKLKLKKGTPFGSPTKKKVYRQNADSWDIFFTRKNEPAIVPSEIRKHKHIERWEKYSGHVYCVQVPNHVVYVRRNGIPVWCGNSNPSMNWRLSSLDKIALVSNSDAHSPNPWRLGREANVFEFSQLTYRGVFDAVRNRDPAAFLFTVEVDPAYGKYHYSGHKKCSVSLPPKESAALNDKCPKCGKKLTVGVLQRVEALADRPEGYHQSGAIPYRTLLPLYEVISFATGMNRLYVKSVIEEQDKLIRAFGSELAVLLEAEPDRLRKLTKEAVVSAIVAVRENGVKFAAGYDGVYGVPSFR